MYSKSHGNKIVKCAVIQLLLITLVQGTDGKSLLVQTTQGPVRGYKDRNEDIFTFYGIPYATAPTGRNRYKAPLPAPSWLTPYEAVDDSIICPQNPTRASQYTGKKIQENCLMANVYVPDTTDKNIPVVIYVHGGGYQAGHGSSFSPKRLVRTENVIIVTFNYRLSIHGFLCLGTEDVPGNAGMKDQVALLRWVKQNIAYFGGNPEHITIAGYSAGSSSVDLLMISPITKGLFTKVIPESGGSLAAFAVQTDPIESAKRVARQFNFTNVDDIYSLEEFYKSATLELITSDDFFERKDSTFNFSPCVERATSEEMFLGDSPYNIIKNGDFEKVPLLYGFTNMEGLFRINLFESWKDDMNDKFSDFLPPDLQFKDADEKIAVANDIKEFYFGLKDVSEDNVLAYVDFFSDVIFTYPVLKAMQLYSEAGHDRIYLYEYSFVDDDTAVVPYTNVRGAQHCAQTIAIFDGAASLIEIINEDSITKDYRNMKQIMRSIWGNFIKTGVPIPEGSQLPPWLAAGARGAPYMSLGRDIQLRDDPLLGQRMAMWDDVYQKHYRPPVPPPPPHRF